MPLYRLTSAAGLDLGTYPGTDEADARDAFARDAGYADYADLIARVPGSSPTDVSADPLAVEVINPWSGALVLIDASNLAQAQLDAYRSQSARAAGQSRSLPASRASVTACAASTRCDGLRRSRPRSPGTIRPRRCRSAAARLCRVAATT